MISPERFDSLQRQWMLLLQGYGTAPADAYPVFDQLAAAYSAPDRHYHTLEHLAEMFRIIARLPVVDRGALQLAVWFHDAVYDSKANDNEDRSAALVGEWLGPLGVPTEVLVKVAAMVRATAHLAGDSPPTDADTAALLDADLAILAAATERYRRYVADVRKEYGWVSDEAYCAGRTAVLERFLARPRLYLTEAMHQEGDESARRNLREEIATLYPRSSVWTTPP